MSDIESNNQSNSIQSIIIVGGGTAGWMTAAAFSRAITTKNCSITLIESDNIGTIGVGEASIPSLSSFNSTLGIDQKEFMEKTQATFKLGINFVDWKDKGESYIHPFSSFGTDIDGLPFFQYWQKAYRLGVCPDLFEYSLAIEACKQNKFGPAQNVPNSPLSTLTHAYHLDAGLYAKYLRDYAEKRGVVRVEGEITSVTTCPKKGIDTVTLKNGTEHSADFFIDCSGFRGILIEDALHAGYDDWSHLLPANKAIAAPSEKLSPLPPYTTATAREVGWQWQIPLQTRTGNGYVYSDNFISDDEAMNIFLSNVNICESHEPRTIKFKTGKRRKIWTKNCLAVGLSSGFVEPLESTSIYLIQSAISKFLALFPQKDNYETLQDRFNQIIDFDYLSIRDFIILHYKVTNREDSEFWRYCKHLDIPKSLKNKIELYEHSSQLYRDNNELFSEPSWISVMHGQGLTAKGYNHIVDAMTNEELAARMNNILKVTKKCVDILKPHDKFIEQYCKTKM